MHDGAIDDIDEAILGELAALHEALDPVPATLTDDIRFAMTVERLHADVAELVATSAMAVRAEETPTRAMTITFSAGPVSLMVAVEDEGPDGLTIDGWVTAGGAHIEVHTTAGTLTARTDEHGRFVVTGVPPGRTWFVVRRAPDDEPPAVVTPPVEL